MDGETGPQAQLLCWKENSSIKQEDFLTDGKVRVRENQHPSGKLSALGEGRGHIMELDLPCSHSSH